MTTEWYQLTTEAVAKQLGSNPVVGLPADEAAKRLAEYGPNELVEKAGKSRWEILREQLTGFLTLILIGAAVISLALGEYLDAIVILIIVILNAVLGYTQEYRAEQAMAALKRMAVPTVRVRREGKLQELRASELTPGDVVVLETGNFVPADGRMIQSVNMRVQEAALTGESEAVEKEVNLVFETERPVADRRNMAYMGTVVNYGRGEMMVTATGMNTELGNIATMIQSVENEQTPLQRRLNRLGKQLAIVAGILVLIVFILGVLRGEDWVEMFKTSVSLAVAAVPEALTAVVTIALSLGAQRMYKRHALIRKLPAVETLGSVSVICSDKTGTLTLNKMTVTAVDIANHQIDLMQRSGAEVLDLLQARPDVDAHALLPTLDVVLIAGALCNDASLVEDETRTSGWHAVGDPTEGALVLMAAEYGVRKPDLDLAFPREAEVPFDSVRKRMTTVHRVPQSLADIPDSLETIWDRRAWGDAPPYMAFTKGALDGLLSITSGVWVEGAVVPMDEDWKARTQASHDVLAAKGMRVLAVALRPLDAAPQPKQMESLEQDLTLVGLFGLLDPPRPEVRAAVETCKAAGIRPVMITGDHPLTARHIARQIGITDNDRFITGQELDKLSLDELRAATQDVSVFARVSPEHKLNLIDAFQQQGMIVAMTGDGVNDAPALKKADIGVAMGITGTDVSKEAADMVLLDDNFATIVAAVEEGRVIYDNIRKFIKYLLSCNTSEIFVMLIGPMLGMPLPLTALQILWMNLVTDGLPALALGVEAAEVNVMKRRPYSSTESVFGRGAVSFIILMGLFLSIVALTMGYLAWQTDTHWQTMLFTTLIFSQLALALGIRSETQSLFKIGVFSNRGMVLAVVSTIVLQLLVIYVPFLQNIFRTQALSAIELAIALGVSLLALVVVELWKWVGRRRLAATTPVAA